MLDISSSIALDGNLEYDIVAFFLDSSCRDAYRLEPPGISEFASTQPLRDNYYSKSTFKLFLFVYLNMTSAHKKTSKKKRKNTAIAKAFVGKKSGAQKHTGRAIKTEKKEEKTQPKKTLLEKILNQTTAFQSSAQHWYKKAATKVAKIKKTNKDSDKKNSEPTSKSDTPSPLWKKILKVILFPLINPYVRYTSLLLILVVVVGLIYVLRDLPSPTRLTSTENYAVSTQIFDRHGTLLYEIFADENRVPVSIDDLPPHVLQAAVAIEDQRFYNHFGFDIIGITRALRNNLQGKPVEGGSTITQQLVKNALLTPERSIQRKIKEAILAVFTEILYSKKQILEMYLNYISYGGTAVGIESASKQYFDKSAKDLTIAEAALLAGLPQAPSRYSPFGTNPQAAKNRQAEVLKRMVDDNYITALQAEEAKAEVLNFALSKTDIKSPHFVFYVRDYLYEQYGVETVEKGGLRVTTTLDLELHETAQASLSAEINTLERYAISNGAGMIVKPDTGEILSMIGSRDYFDTANDGQVNVTLAQRQPGSSIKPIMYATAFQNKILNPGSILLDVPTCFEVPGQKEYCPKNYDGTFKGPVTVRKSLGNSLNIPAVKGLAAIGLVPFIDQATAMGITTWTDPSNYGLSLTLGGGEVRMIDMAQAYSTLANQGVKVPLTPILKVEDFRGNLIDQTDLDQRKEDLQFLTEYDVQQENDLERVMDRAPAYLASHIMQDNNARLEAFGPRSELVIENQVVSAKTGTTNDIKDNWTVGFTPEYLVITWVGNNDGSPMNPYLVSGVTGAAPIFNDIMSYVLQGKEPVWQEKPPSVASSGVCANGMPPNYKGNENCSVRYTELFWKDSQPSTSNVITKQVWIKEATGLPATEGDNEGVRLEERTFYEDPVTTIYCTNCGQPTEDGKVNYQQSVVRQESNQEVSQ
jgi:penicillin-binding protein 1C